MNLVWCSKSTTFEPLPCQSRAARHGRVELNCFAELESLIQKPCFCRAFVALIPEFSSTRQKHDA